MKEVAIELEEIEPQHPSSFIKKGDSIVTSALTVSISDIDSEVVQSFDAHALMSSEIW